MQVLKMCLSVPGLRCLQNCNWIFTEKMDGEVEIRGGVQEKLCLYGEGVGGNSFFTLFDATGVAFVLDKFQKAM